MDELPKESALRKWLAENDQSCGSCGYNLRGATTVVCPECGTVIPNLSASVQRRMETPLRELRLACRLCGHTVQGVETSTCPKCAGEMVQYIGRPPVARTRAGWRRLPIGMAGAVVCGFLLAVTAVTTWGDRPWALSALGGLFALGPVIVAVWWLKFMPRLQPSARRRGVLVWVCSLGAIGMVVVAAAIL